MGFDPRRWSPESRVRGVTSNVEALLTENAALRRENQALRRELERLLRRQSQSGREGVRQSRGWGDSPDASQDPPRITAEQVKRWGVELARQHQWQSLTTRALEALVNDLNHRSFHPKLSLRQRLDHLLPQLGTDLFCAIGEPTSKKQWAVLAAFALYGLRTAEWLEEAPDRVVLDLRQRLPNTKAGRRTRSDRRRSDRPFSQTDAVGAPLGADPSRIAAFSALNLQWGANRTEIKNAHRRMVKRHHPDVGGDAEAFRRITEAYQLLIT